MKIFSYPDVDLRFDDRPLATLGNFDGVHLGHQAAMALLRERASLSGSPSMVITFEPHPVSVLRPESAPKRLMTAEQKAEAIAAEGVDRLIIVRFSQEFSKMAPREFVADFLVGSLGVSELVLGGNFRFGTARSGDLATLRGFGAEFGFSVHEVSPSIVSGEMISSSRIRASILSGELDGAAAMLGRPYFVQGIVVAGDGRGRTIGFPTANLEVNGDVLVEDGVYVTSTEFEGQKHQSMTHLGHRPTFGVTERAIETHLLNFDANLYGKKLTLSFFDRIRGTVAFDSADALRNQLMRDQSQVRSYFAQTGRNLVP